MITLYDLAITDDVRPSPFCWRTKFALAHKGLAWKEEPVGFTDKDKIAFSDQKLVPVIVDHAHADKEVHDSWDIALYLDKTYPDRPLFKSEQEQAFARFTSHWTGLVVHAGIFPLIVDDLYARVRPQDRDYFRESRAKRFGTDDFEAVQATARETRLAAFRQSLEPLRQQLKAGPFLGGATPAYADYTAAGAFLWAHGASPFALLDTGDSVISWRDRVIDFYGFGQRAVAAT